jgi:hypothetical protein
MITLQEARRLAQSMAMEQSASHYKGRQEDVLEDKFVRSENCWIFFRRRSISTPREASFVATSYAVSKDGRGSLIADFWDDEQCLNEYLRVMSDYYSRR